MIKSTLTQKRLKELLHYNPKSGDFTWLIANSRRVYVGMMAGTHSRGYTNIMVDSNMCRAHRLAFLYMTGHVPEQVDHINHIRNDNRWANLRPATSLINNKNRSRKSKTGCTGIYWHKASNKWMARIKVDGKQIYLGTHDSFFEACCVRKSANIRYGFHPNHGETGYTRSLAA